MRLAPPVTEEECTRRVKHGVRSIRTAAEFLGVSDREVRRLITDGQLWSFRKGGKRVIPLVDLRIHLAQSAYAAVKQ